MRLSMLACLAAAAAACSVPDKEAALDAGGDAGVPTDAIGDPTKPETTITAAPAEFAAAGMAVFRFESSDPAAHFECSVDGEPSMPCTSPVTRTLEDGSHTFSVRAISEAGDADDSPAEHLWTIDTVAPNTSIVTKPPIVDNSVTVKFTFTATERNVLFECALDGATFTGCESNDSLGPIGDGPHTFSVRARDRSGNADATPSSYSWSVDTSTPDTTLVSGPSGPTASADATFTFVSPDAGAGATFTCSIDSTAFVACTSPRTYVGLAAGAHTFAVRVRDAVGNMDPTPATASWIVDVTAPSTTITGGPTGLVSQTSASFTFTASEAGSTFECKLDAEAFAACTSPKSYLALAQGAHSFAVRATDAAMHTDASPATRAWTIDTVAPIVTITGGPAEASTSGPRVIFTFTANDGVVTCSLDGAAFTACTSPVSRNLPAGAHELRVRAVDTAGNTGMDTRAWTVACAAPGVFGAAGLLHLDDAGQTLANAVTGGIDATLGDDLTVEPGDPTAGTGRFGGGLAFANVESDHVAWPAALGATSDFTVELWAQPNAPAGLRDLVTSGDGRVAVRVTAASPTTVRFSASIVETGAGAMTRTVTSAAVPAGAWHHVLVSLSEPTLRLWVDGVRVEVATVALGTPVAFDTLRLGGDAATAYSGSLDEVWLAQTAITADEPALARYCPL
ncbi:MAG: LamG domain-containing protein [Kofleriaceae bacterium]